MKSGLRFPFTRELLRAWWREIWADDCLDLAAQTSYFLILAIFPFFIVLAAIVGYLPITIMWHDVVLWIVNYFPRASRHVVINTVLDLTQSRTGFLSFGVAASALSASTAVMSLMNALNIVLGVKETRGYWKRRAVALGMVLVICLSFLTAFGLLTVGGELGQWLERVLSPGAYFEQVWKLGRWVGSILLLMIGALFVESALPNRRRPWRWLSAGAVFVVGASVVASLGLRLYVQHFTTYPTAYGTLGSVFVLMLWVYVETLLVLIGAELNSQLEKFGKKQAAAYSS